MAKGTKRIRKPGERLRQIKEKAAELFFKRGYDKTSIADIAEALEIEKASLYHYIKSKEELLSLLLEDFLGKLISTSQPYARKIDDMTVKELRQYLVEQVRTFLSNQRLAVVYFRDRRALAGEWKEKVEELEQEYLGLLTEILKTLPRRPRILSNPRHLTYAFLGLASSLVERLAPHVEQLEETAKQWVEFFIGEEEWAGR